MHGDIPSPNSIRLHFLGGCRIEGPAGPVPLESAKTYALLVYLALSPGPQARHRLMGLLWGDLPEASARRNLRHALWNLRRNLNLPGRPPLILSDRQGAGLNRQADCYLDVEQFEAASALLLDEPAPAGLQLSGAQPPAPRTAGLPDLLILYGGDLLEGFYLDDAPAFEEWLLVERERLRRRALHALHQMVERLAGQGDYQAALLHAQRLLDLDPWREEAHCAVMRLLALCGQRSAALAQYATCRRVLAEELGIEPAAETRALYEQILHALPGSKPEASYAQPSALRNIPSPTTPFIGRQEELAQLAQLLADSNCRLVTITGPGGVGKTRLAIRAAAQIAEQEAASFPQGVAFVPLGGLTSLGDLPGAIAESLHFSFFGPADPWLQLSNYLREKQLLLVLDTFEHLLGGAELLAGLLNRCRKLKMLVTSRERLHLLEEWVLPLEGLPFPPHHDEGEIEAYGAGQLFLQTAGRVHLGFKLREPDRPWVARVCRLVEGLPLAVELAAAWVRALSCQEIAQEMEQALDLLAASTSGDADRHRSLRAVFDRSWALLNEEEQRVFEQLSVFRGSFSRRAAEQVAGASLPILSALLDKSLLRRNTAGRYELHELLRKYAAERLHAQPAAEEEAARRHAAYFAGALRKEVDLARHNPKSAFLAGLVPDVDNLRTAWGWAVGCKDSALVETMASGMDLLCQVSAHFQEGEGLFREAFQALGWSAEALEDAAAAGDLLPFLLLLFRAGFSARLGKHAEARPIFERCLAVFRRHGANWEVATCLYYLGDMARLAGNYAAAREYLQEGRAIFEGLAAPSAAGFCLNDLGLIARAEGQTRLAEELLEKCLADLTAAGDPWGQAIAGINLAAVRQDLDQGETARHLLERSLALCQALNNRWGMATCLNLLGDIAGRQGNSAAAADYHDRAQVLMKEIGLLPA